MKKWKVDISHANLAQTNEGEIFQQWSKQFQKRCKEKNWLDRASLADAISQQIEQKNIALPAQINLRGFIEISPQIHQLLTVCELHGAKISVHEIDDINQSAY